MARWIHITKAPFDYRWPDRSALTAFTAKGDQFVKDEIADFAVARGYAKEGKARKSSRSRKGKAERTVVAETAADSGPDDKVADEDLVVATGTVGGIPGDPDAG